MHAARIKAYIPVTDSLVPIDQSASAQTWRQTPVRRKIKKLWKYF